MDLKLEAITTGYVFKANYILPQNASDYLNAIADPFDVTPEPIKGLFNEFRRSVDEFKPNEQPENEPVSEPERGYDYEQHEKFERYQNEAEVVQIGTESTSHGTEEMIDNDVWLDIAKNNHNNPSGLKNTPYLGRSRFSLYKGIAAVAERLARFNTFTFCVFKCTK